MTRNVAFHTDETMPADLQAQQAELEHRRALAEAMMQQQMRQQSEQPPAGGRLSALNPIAQALSGYMAGKAGQDAARGTQDLQRRSQADLAAAMDKYRTQSAGTPPPPRPPDLQESDIQMDQGVPPDPTGAIQGAMVSKHPLMRHMAERDFAAEAARKQHERDIAARAEEHRKALRLQKELKVDESIPDDWNKHIPTGTKAGQMPGTFTGTDGDLMQMQFKDGKYVGARNVNTLPKPPVSTTNNFPAVTVARIVDPKNPSRMIEVDARRYNEAKYMTGDNTGVIGESGKESAKQERVGKREFSMNGIGLTINSARRILDGKGDEKLPTGSYAGTAYDFVGSLVGFSPQGAKEADKMRALGGALTSKMPRMEGPQSDRDTIQYKEMAGRVGDSTLPRDRRLAALEQVEELWAKYEHLNPGVLAGTDSPSTGGALNTAEKARLEELRKKRGLK